MEGELSILTITVLATGIAVVAASVWAGLLIYRKLLELLGEWWSGSVSLSQATLSAVQKVT